MKMNALRAQLAAVAAILILALTASIPWLAGSHVLKPCSAKWSQIIQRKDELLVERERLAAKIGEFQNMDEKKKANDLFQRSMDQTGLDSIQGLINNGKYSISNFRTVSLDSKETSFSFVASYNTLGQLLTDLWNTFQFVELSSLAIKSSPNRPDEDVVATLTVRLPQSSRR